MACEYFVGGKYISENEFKALLNEGLLDTLVSNKKIDMKGFKVDPNKAISQEPKTIKRLTVPASKLAQILINEVKSSQGYPANMLSALELNAAGTDFKIPLWASPYADKFESLLTSLVSNKVIKQKLPGGSYVLGSEEGFKVKEGDAAAGELKNSNIVFSSKFDPEQGLQPLRYDPETGKILPAQIMIPFKFRDEQGNILNIKEFVTIDADGRQILDTTKIPEKLLQLFGFRIPTQERNSMAAVEIVGFLPESSADLMLAPRDFTKQMGSDFDVDKLYTYMYNHYYLNGKLYTNFKSNSKDIDRLTKLVKDQIQELTDNMKISKADKKLIETYIRQVVDSNAGEGAAMSADVTAEANALISKAIAVKSFSEENQQALKNAITQLSVLNRSYQAARQNKLLDLHLEVMTSSNPEVVASIIALDSYGEFEGLAAKVAEIQKAKTGSSLPITILSDVYQRTKYINAVAGKSALGVFSLASTFNASAQGKDLVYLNLSPEMMEDLFGTPKNPRVPTPAMIMEFNDPIATFGTSISKGDLSNKYTLRSQLVIAKAKAEKRDLTKEEKESLKFKSTIIRALQSTAADNEKAQILDKINVNENSLKVATAMSLLGFEETDIVGLLTQDIIVEYFEALNKTRSSLTSFQENAAEKIREALVTKYDPQKRLEGISPEEYAVMSQMANKSGAELLDMLANGEYNPNVSTSYNLTQLMLLDKFLRLTDVGADLQQVQSTINSESRGVPKSLLETSNKVTQIDNLGQSKIFNATKLLGTYNSEKGVYEPNTINGFAAIYGTQFANTIYRPFFPYQNVGFQTLYQEILTHTPSYSKGQSMAKLTEAQRSMFKNVKSFLYGSSDTNLFTGTADEERFRIFMDTENNQSLASILSDLKSQAWFQKNAFLNKLDFNINTNGSPSRIEFEAATAENFDEKNIYEGFLSLLDKNFPVGTYNGIAYTSRTLAQDLVAAAFLEGGTQGSKQYMKYVPIVYLKTLGFGEYLANSPLDFTETFRGTLTESGIVYNQPSAFTRQYFQNNPELVKTVALANLKEKVKDAPKLAFTLNKESMEDNFVDTTDPITGEPTKVQTQFLSIKLPKGQLALYEFDTVDKVYRRIPVLKDKYGFVQYNAQSNNPTPIEISNITAEGQTPQVAAPGYTIQNIPAETHKEFNVDDVNNTEMPAPLATLPISRTLSGTAEALDDLINALVDSGEVSTPNIFLLNTLQGLARPSNFKLVYTNDANIKGNYDYATGTLTINPNNKSLNTFDDVATLVAHELVHAATGLTIKEYEAGLTDKLTSSQIQAVESLKSLQNKYIEYLASQGKAAQLTAFTEDYKAWKKGNKSINFTQDQISDFYGAMKLSEFVTMALTDVAFQERLKNIQDAETKSLWNQIIDAITELINTLGITIPKGSILAGALKSSMDLIQANQEAFKQPTIINTVQKVNIYEQLKKLNKKVATKGDYAYYVRRDGTANPQTDLLGKVVAVSQNGFKVQKPDGTMSNWQNYKTTNDRANNPYHYFASEILEEKKDEEEDVFFPDVEFEQEVNTEEGSTIVQELKYELFPGVYANQGQREAIDLLTDFLGSTKKEFLLQGKGGTGKTTIIKKILEDAQKKNLRVLGVAPTHKAKKVLNKSMPNVKTVTLASALAIKLDETTGNFVADEFARSRGRVPIKGGDLIIIDESSMISDKLLQELRTLANGGAKIIFMGDRAQLPPVGQETDSNVFKVDNGYELTEKMRQAATSPIIGIGTKIAANVETTGQRVANPITEADRVSKTDSVSGSSIIWESSEGKALDSFVEDIQNANGDVNYAKIVTFNNQSHNSPQSVKNLNNKVRRKLFGPDADNTQFMPGELLTAYDTYGGEEPVFFNSEDLLVKSSKHLGPKNYVVRAYSASKGERTLNVTVDTTELELINEEGKVLKNPVVVVSAEGKAEFANTLAKLFKTDPQMAYALKDKFGNLEYGYAVTSHKAQGSTYTNVYVMEDNIMGPSNGGTIKSKNQSLYVAVSRPTTKLVMVSNKNGGVASKAKLDLSGLRNTEDFMQMPPELGDNYGGPSAEDWELLNRMRSQDESLADSPINKELYEKYLLLCGK